MIFKKVMKRANQMNQLNSWKRVMVSIAFSGLLCSFPLLSNAEEVPYVSGNTNIQGNFEKGNIQSAKDKKLFKPGKDELISPFDAEDESHYTSSDNSLGFSYVPNFNFGVSILPDEKSLNIAGKLQNYSKLTEGSEIDYEYYMQAFFILQDVRGTNSGWRVQLQATPFVNKLSADDVIVGSAIYLSGAKVYSNGVEGDKLINYLDRKEAYQPLLTADELINDKEPTTNLGNRYYLKEVDSSYKDITTVAQDILAAPVGSGAGTTYFVFDQTYEPDFEWSWNKDSYENVLRTPAQVLRVPQGAVTEKGKAYQSDLTWSIIAGP